MSYGIRLLGFAALAFAAALVLFVSSRDNALAQPPFEPGVVYCLEDFGTPAECDGNTDAGANADIRTRFCVGWNSDCSVKDNPVTDSNFGGVVSFTPAAFNVPKSSDVPVGAIAGRLTAESTLGLLNNPCSSIISPAFTMMNASINTGDTIQPKAVGLPNPLEPLGRDANGNGVPDGADKYPVFLNELFDNAQPHARLFGVTFIQGTWVTLNFVFFSPGQELTIGGTTITFNPDLGYPSITVLNDPTVPASPSAITDFCAPLLSGTVILGQTLNNPCTGQALPNANCPSAGTPTENRGFPYFPCEAGNGADEDGDGKINDGCPQVNQRAESGAECDNNTSDDGEDSDINDGCPPNGDVSESGRIPGSCSGTDEGGCSQRTNPAAGTYNFTLYALSQRDADGDGIENSLDVCSTDANAGWNGRGPDPQQDPDSDGLPSACDPEPNTASPNSPPGCPSGITGGDQDGDCFANRADNCPTDNQLRDPNSPPSPDNLPNIADGDADGIGDACDPNPEAPNGENVQLCLQAGVAIGAGPAAPAVGQRMSQPGPECAAASITVEGPTPVPATPAPGAPTPRTGGTTGGGSGSGGLGGAGTTGVGSLAPTATGLPLWGLALAAIGGAGLLGGLGLMTSRALRRRSGS